MHARTAATARATYAISQLRIFAKTVSRMIRRPGAIQYEMRIALRLWWNRSSRTLPSNCLVYGPDPLNRGRTDGDAVLFS